MDNPHSSNVWVLYLRVAFGTEVIMEDRCICCGEIIPEGRQVCPQCEHMSIKKQHDDLRKEERKDVGRSP